MALELVASSRVIALCIATSSIATAMVRALALDTVQCPIIIVLVASINYICALAQIAVAALWLVLFSSTGHAVRRCRVASGSLFAVGAETLGCLLELFIYLFFGGVSHAIVPVVKRQLASDVHFRELILVVLHLHLHFVLGQIVSLEHVLQLGLLLAG